MKPKQQQTPLAPLTRIEAPHQCFIGRQGGMLSLVTILQGKVVLMATGLDCHYQNVAQLLNQTNPFLVVEQFKLCGIDALSLEVTVKDINNFNPKTVLPAVGRDILKALKTAKDAFELSLEMVAESGYVKPDDWMEEIGKELDKVLKPA